MKKKQIYLILTMTAAMTLLGGCGNGNRENTTTPDTEEKVTTENVVDNTEKIAEPTESTNQLQLGSAVEIPEGWNGSQAEMSAHDQLEKVIAEHLAIPEENWENTRYYYNFVDLNGDSKKEILAMVVMGDGKTANATSAKTAGEKTTSVSSDVEKINETSETNAVGTTEKSAADVQNGDMYTLLWIEADTDQIKTNHIRQEFKNVRGPVYISNHMTDGYRDLIVCENTVQSANDSYRLLVWDGSKYMDVEQGDKLESLEGYEGDAILTNNMVNNGKVEDYHFLGKAAK